jgi:hypothetical protein
MFKRRRDQRMKQILFDIETIANPAIIPLLPPVEAKGNLTDPVKIAADIAEKKQKQTETLGLDKTTCLICCVTTLDVDEGEPQSIILNPDTLDEKALLEEFWEVVHPYSKFVTFNGNGFDVPVLTFRSMINRVQPSVQISTQKYRISNHIDVRAILGNWDTHAKGTLDFYSKIILGESKADDVDGSFVQAMFDVGAYDEIKAYNQAECQSLKAIYERLKGYYF